jgi:hypothetical protein
MLGKLFDRLLGARPWYRLPGLLAALKIIRIRNELRERNLYDTEELPFEKVDPAAADPKYRQERTLDGTYNDLAYPRMGSAGTRFGRNFALEHTRPETGTLLDPNPRAVSQKLMTRHAFQPATSLNLMAASWIQFMVHDWFVHEQSDSEHIEVPGTPGDRSGEPGGYGAMRVPRTRTRPRLARHGRPPTGTSTRIGGTARRSTARMSRSLPGCVPSRMAGSGSATMAFRSSMRPPVSISPASPTTGGLASARCTRSSRASTMRSAIA